MYQGHNEDVYIRGQEFTKSRASGPRFCKLPEIYKHRVMPVVHTTFYFSRFLVKFIKMNLFFMFSGKIYQNENYFLQTDMALALHIHSDEILHIHSDETISIATKQFVVYKRCVSMNRKMEQMNEEIPELIAKRAEQAVADLLPQKSRVLYEKEYEKFEKWMNENLVKIVNETVLMGYFQELVCIFCYF